MSTWSVRGNEHDNSWVFLCLFMSCLFLVCFLCVLCLLRGGGGGGRG